MAAANMQAQNKTFQLPDFKNGKAVWIVRAGVGFNGVAGSNKETQRHVWENRKRDGDFKYAIGYETSIGFNKSFGNHPMYWGMELGLGTRGYKTSATFISSGSSAVSGGSDYHAAYDDETLLCHTVKLSPFTIGYKYTFLKNMAADVHLGAYASYDFAGNYKTKTRDIISSTSNKYGNRYSDKTTENKTNISDLDGMRRYDAGFNLGIGYWYGKFNLDFTWQRGFIAIYEGGDEKITIGKEKIEKGSLFSNNFQLKVGYAF